MKETRLSTEKGVGSELCRERLEKQILQLKQENHILEEANARYSLLQLVEAQVCFSVFL